MLSTRWHATFFSSILLSFYSLILFVARPSHGIHINGPIIEHNPNYVSSETTLGEIMDESYHYPFDSHFNDIKRENKKRNMMTTFTSPLRRLLNFQEFSKSQPGNFFPQTTSTQQQTQIPLSQIVRDFACRLHSQSPFIFFGSLTSLIIYVFWQINYLTPILQRHFVCSKTNIFDNKCYHTLLFSAISHNSLNHLGVNLYAFFTFGKKVEEMLLRSNGRKIDKNISMCLFCVGSALFGNIVFLLLSPRGSSCIGLSGVTLSLMTLYARKYPDIQLGFVIHFIPVRLRAEYMLIGVFVISVIGVLKSLMGSVGGGNIAHATHLGGLIFGLLYFECYFATNRLLQLSLKSKQLKRIYAKWMKDRGLSNVR